MLRNVIIHLLNDQPLLADLSVPPKPSDSAVVCTNLRTFNGKPPVFAAESSSTFVFPMDQIRFVELPVTSMEGAAASPSGETVEAEGHLDRRAARDDSRDEASAVRLEALRFSAEADPEDPTEDLLRRIREA